MVVSLRKTHNFGGINMNTRVSGANGANTVQLGASPNRIVSEGLSADEVLSSGTQQASEGESLTGIMVATDQNTGLPMEVLGQDGSLNFHIDSALVSNFIFQHASTVSPGDGLPGLVYGLSTILTSIYVTPGASFAVSFYQSTDGNIYLPVAGINTNNYSSLATSTSQTNVLANDKNAQVYGENWQFNIAGGAYLLMKVTSITNGSITITGNALLGG